MLRITRRFTEKITFKHEGEEGELEVTYRALTAKEKVAFESAALSLRPFMDAEGNLRADSGEALGKVQAVYREIGNMVLEKIEGLEVDAGEDPLEIAREFMAELVAYVGERAVSRSAVQVARMGKSESSSDSPSTAGSAPSSEAPAST